LLLSGWTSQDSGTTDLLRGVWGSGPNDIFAVGRNADPAVQPYGVIDHFDGTRWTAQQVGTMPLVAVGGSGPDDIYAVGGLLGSPGVVLHSSDDGQSWLPLASFPQASLPSSSVLRGVWADPAGDVYITGGNGVFVYSHDHGSTWTIASNGPQGSTNGVWGSGSDDVYVAGGPDSIQHSSDGGTTWTSQTLASDSLLSVWGSGANDVYAVGGNASRSQLIFHSSDGGATWVSEDAGASSELIGVWGSGPNDVYAVGFNGTILHSSGDGSWTTEDSGTANNLYGVWGSGPGDVVAVGANGTILTLQDRSQQPFQSITFGALADKTYGDADFALTATASSGLPISYTATGVASVYQDSNGNWFAHITGVGAATITATQSGNSDYFAATPVSQSFTVRSLQNALDSLPTGGTLTVQTTTPQQASDVLAAANALDPTTTPTSTLIVDLGGQAIQDTTIEVPPQVTVQFVNGTFIGGSPALIVQSGQVVVRNSTFSNATNAATILVTGGSLTLRGDTIQESTGYSQSAIAITGGTVDLGTTSDPGDNTLNINGTGEFIHNTTSTPVSAVGDTFAINGAPQSASALSFTALTSSAASTILQQVVTLTAAVRANASSGTPGGSVDFFDATTNTDLGRVTLSGGVATLKTSSLSVGNHVIVATYSGDGNYLPSFDTITQSVHYNLSGFRPPLDSDQPIKIGRTVPIQFQLTDANGQAITSLSAVVSLQLQALDANGNAIGAPFSPPPTGGTRLRNDGGQYIFNWQTKGLHAGSYELLLSLNDGTTSIKKLQLTAGPGSDAQKSGKD
jgi:hypothetical protein